MKCPNCEALRERVRILERELGIRYRDGAIGAIMTRLDVTGHGARLLMLMYEANGRAVSFSALEEQLHSPSSNQLKVQIYKLRQVLGENAIETARGLGYGLAAPGLSQVMAAIWPPDTQDARGG